MTDTLLSRLADALRECADDLAVECSDRYPGRSLYSVEMRCYARDMQPIIRARALLAEWEEKKQR